ncbi:MAG TPA: hypothetical protein EYO31_04570 [Phycisphaerales bacterium]|nr:hypothetical protein [Phycisphaerales bacterium]
MSDPHLQSNQVEDHEDPDAHATWAIGLSGAFLMIATVALTCGIFYRSATTEAHDKNINIRYEQRNMIMASQQAVLEESSHWVSEHNPDDNKAINRLVIPIDRAMDIVAGNHTKQ